MKIVRFKSEFVFRDAKNTANNRKRDWESVKGYAKVDSSIRNASRGLDRETH